MADSKGFTQEIAADLNSAAIHLLRGLRTVDRRSGLTAARLSALSVLVFGGPRTLARLADAEDVRPPTMAGIVDGLCALGLASRGPHPDHARMVVVSATSTGIEVMEQARADRLEVIATALLRLPGTDREAISAAAPVLSALAVDVPRIARELESGAVPGPSQPLTPPG